MRGRNGFSKLFLNLACALQNECASNARTRDVSMTNTKSDMRPQRRFVEYWMSVPSKANIGKPDNLARVRVNHRPGTEPCV